MKKICSTLALCLGFGGVALAQDPNFSQFFSSPLTLNPAQTGKFDGEFRVAGNYRNQWPTISNAYTTTTVSFDMGIMKNKISNFDQFGVGVLGFRDQAGDGALTNNYFGLSTAYHKALDENGYHSIGAGFQGTYVNKRLNTSNLKFQDQLTPFGFTNVSNDIYANRQLSISYFDLNAGFMYSGTTNGYNNFYLGASMYHINRPRENFQGGDFILSARTTIQGGAKVPVGVYNSFHFSANHSMQAKAKNTIAGGAFCLNVNNDEDNPTNVYLGSWYRFQDAIIPYVGLEWGEWHLGATYDVNTSSLKAASQSRGGVELSLIFIKKYTDPSMKKLNCPKF